MNCSAMEWTMGAERELLRLQSTRAASTTLATALSSAAEEIAVMLDALADAAADCIDVNNNAVEGSAVGGDIGSPSDPGCSLELTSCDLLLFSLASFTIMAEAASTNCSKGEML